MTAKNNSEFFTWKKGEKVQLSTNFSTSEFSCKCKNKSCVEQRISKELIERLQRVRNEYGAIIVTSAFRCDLHNKAVGGASLSQHRLGRAVDAKPASGHLSNHPVHDMDRLRNEFRKEFNGIGVHPRFVHGDVRKNKAEWKY